MEITAYRLSKSTGIPQSRTCQIIKNKRGLTVDTALRLSKYFGTSNKSWLACNMIMIWKSKPTNNKTSLTKLNVKLSNGIEQYA